MQKQLNQDTVIQELAALLEHNSTPADQLDKDEICRFHLLTRMEVMSIAWMIGYVYHNPSVQTQPPEPPTSHKRH